MKSHDEIYREEFAALFQAGVDKQSPDEVKAYLESLAAELDGKDESNVELLRAAIYAFVKNCPAADDGRWIFPAPVNGEYPVEFVAVLHDALRFEELLVARVFSDHDRSAMNPAAEAVRSLAFEFAWLEFKLRWADLTADAADPVEMLEILLEKYLRLYTLVHGSDRGWTEINVRAILSGECRDIDAVHKLMDMLRNEYILAKLGKDKAAQLCRMVGKVFDVRAEQEYIDREFAQIRERIDADAEARFSVDASREQVLKSWNKVAITLSFEYWTRFPWVAPSDCSTLDYKVWGITEIKTRFDVFGTYAAAFDAVAEIREFDNIEEWTSLDSSFVRDFVNGKIMPELIPGCGWSRDVLTWLENFRLAASERLKKMVDQGLSEFSLPFSKIKFLNLVHQYLCLPDELETYIENQLSELVEKKDIYFADPSLMDPAAPPDLSFSEGLAEIRSIDKFERSYRENMRRLEEAEIRRQVLFEMSHSIKNLIASVTDPLDQLRGKLKDEDDRFDIENALTGAKLIRELALQVHMSMRGQPGAWRKDWKRESGSRFDGILEQALRYAVNNMFSGKYFGRFTESYFGDSLERYHAAKMAVESVRGLDELAAVLTEHFFDCRIDIPETLRSVRVGDAEGTATKFLILFQEILLNAVKYAAFAERSERFITIRMEEREGGFTFETVNSAGRDAGAENPNGIGHIVIRNFAELFQAEHRAGYSAEGNYEVKLDFSLDTEKRRIDHVEDPVH